jgi:hypothetical protein
MKNKIALFIANYTIANSPSILNLLSFLSHTRYVHLYIDNVSLMYLPAYVNKRSVKVIKNKYYRRIASLNKYQAIIAIDPYGFYLYQTTLGLKDNCFYYSLELYLKNDHYGLSYPEEISTCERKYINTIKGLIIQSHEKEFLFREDYNLRENIPTFILPVTGRGPSVSDKSDFLRKKYLISDNKKIALHLGGIAEWFSCIEIAFEFSQMNDWILFFQGYPSNEYLAKFKKALVDRSIGNVILSETCYDNIDDLNETIKSCDIGIAWYNDISVGFRVAGRSSGKITSYLRYGLPIIAKKYDSTMDAIHQTGCGRCVDKIGDIKHAIGDIMANYDSFVDNCHKVYDKTYDFNVYQNPLMTFLEKSNG